MTDVVMFDEWKWRHAFGIIRAEIGLAYAKLQVLKDEINAARSALRHADVSDEARQECHDVLKAVRMEMGAFSNKLSYLLDEPKGSRAKFASRIVTSRIDEAIDILDDALPDDDADY